MKILLVGSKGQLAHDVALVMSGAHTLEGVDLPEVNITNPGQVAKCVQSAAPEIIINCAAYTKVDACEKNRELAMAINATGPGLLAEAALNCGARLIHISTDYIFDGQRQVPTPYTEDDPPGPLSCYGETKLEGERAIAASGARYAILRTAWLYGIHGHNFPKVMLTQALHHPDRELKVVNDQHGSPTWSWRLARQIARVVEADADGLFHATSEGYCTWYDFARRFLEQMAVPFRMRPCDSSEYPTPAIRPRNSILDNRRLKQAGLNVMEDWRVDVDEFVRRHRAQLLAEVRR